MVYAIREEMAQTIAQMALSLGTSMVAHGCTAAGNDQVRFEAAGRIEPRAARPGRVSAKLRWLTEATYLRRLVRLEDYPEEWRSAPADVHVRTAGKEYP